METEVPAGSALLYHLPLGELDYELKNKTERSPEDLRHNVYLTLQDSRYLRTEGFKGQYFELFILCCPPHFLTGNKECYHIRMQRQKNSCTDQQKE